jgi:Iron-containing redox enzyme
MLPILFGAGQRLVAHPRIAELYPEYLITMHWLVRASVPLMEVTRDRALSMAGNDPVCAAVARYLTEHIPEELDHDEWLLEDLQVLGRDRASVLTRPPSPTVAGAVGAQYYWVQHYHPVALLGYLLLLEGYPPLPAEIEALIARTRHSPSAFRTLLAHAELDPHHGDVLDETLDALTLTREQSTMLGLSAMHSAQALASALVEIVDGAA